MPLREKNTRDFSTKHSTREAKPKAQELILSFDTEIVNLNQPDMEIKAKTLQKFCQGGLPSDRL